ncbi:MAG: hypothetical protein KC620_18190 [Myxococcales bacterium]|nr:hypothetical protein [Myxococcales bacterium]
MRLPLLVFFVGLAVYAAFAGGRLRMHSPDNHFVYLADAFLHGQVELTRNPHHQNDWASYDELTLKGQSAEQLGPTVKGFFTRRKGKADEFRLLDGREVNIPRKDRGESKTHYFVSFPPAPAVLMMPWVAAVGYGTNDVIFTVLFAALNGVLIFLLLRRLRLAGHSERSQRDELWLTLLFAFGTAHLWCAVLGRVWFTALIVGVTFHLAYLYFAVDARRPLLAGICLAAAFSTRATLVFAAVFFYLQLFRPNSGTPFPVGERWRRFILFSAPCGIVGLALLAYNQARFGNPMEFGHTFLANGTLPRIRDFGLFHPNFLNRNLASAFTLVPRLVDTPPYIQISKHGLSMLLTTPALVWLLWPTRQSPLARAMGWTALVVAVPIFFYQNTGWEQFSFRFALDFMPYLVCCLALGGRSFGRGFRTLILVGVLVNAIGAATFHRAGKLYADFLTEEPQR